jgi:hypothetical protein
MTQPNRPLPAVERRPALLPPQWERQRRHRVLLERRMRSVRRALLAGGVVGTVAFSVLAAYETEHANNASADTSPPLPAPESQLGAANFFTGQASAALGAASPTATAIPSETATPTATAAATEIASATPDANATTSAASNAAATKTAKAAATATKSAKIEATQTAKAEAAATKTARAEIAATATAQAEAAAEETAAAAPVQSRARTQSS